MNKDIAITATNATDADAVVAWLKAQGAQSLCCDTRHLQAKLGQQALLAWPGSTVNAQQWVEWVRSALREGRYPCAVVEAQGTQALEQAKDPRVLRVRGLKAMAGEVASRFYDEPSKKLRVLAFTGTNGKSSSAWWCAQLLSRLGKGQQEGGSRVGLIGTLGVTIFRDGARASPLQPTGLTTPDPVRLHETLRALVDQGCWAVALEASSIGIAEGRLNGLHIDTAVFTNFTQDHLDYHASMAAYWQAKAALFDRPGLRHAVINLDDPQGFVLQEQLSASRAHRTRPDIWTVGMHTPAPVRLRARSVSAHPEGMVFVLQEQEQSCTVHSRVFGHYNVQNLLGVIATARAVLQDAPGEASLTAIAEAIPHLSDVPGRLEAVSAVGDAPLVLVDYAHTPDALAQVLGALRTTAQSRKGQLWCVFGCGGERDASKRPLMGAIAHAKADRLVITSDNPRGESPQHIVAQILAGIGEDPSVDVEPDRHRAIEYAISQAQPNDVILIAGKGHEDYQEIKGVKHPFSDAAVASEALLLHRVFGFGESTREAVRVSTDTRSLQAGDVFVALIGEHFDAHDFLAQVQQKGARLAVVQQGHRSVRAAQAAGLPLPLMAVPNTLAALGMLARHHRQSLSPIVIAVTGSNGKTTLTQMIASVLRAWQGERACATQGNLNNEIGVPLTLLGLRPQHRCAVIELGMNHPGEIARLSRMTAPHVAVVNNAQREHQEFMGSVEAVARENGAVIEALGPSGVAVFPADEPYTAVWEAMSQARAEKHPGTGSLKVIRFEMPTTDTTAVVAPTPAAADKVGLAAPPTWLGDAWAITAHTPAGPVRYRLRMVGTHNIKNSLACIAACIGAGVPRAAIEEGLTRFEAMPGRSQLQTLRVAGRTVTLVDDTYNANPDSCLAAIDTLLQLPAPRVLILGDMGEVGDQGPLFHTEVGQYTQARGIDLVLCLGYLTEHTARAAHGQWFGDNRAALEAAATQACSVAGSIWVKGSRLMHMEQVIAHLLHLHHPKETPSC